MNVGEIIGVSLFAALVVCLILFFIIRASVFSKKFNTIKNGMSYNEVVNLLGMPDSSTSAEGIMTCVWSRAVVRGFSNHYTITLKNNMVLSVIKNSNIS